MESLAGHPSDWPTRRWLALTLAVLLLSLALLGARQIGATLGLPAGRHDYNVAAWEVRHFANKWLFDLGAQLRDAPSAATQDEYLLRFLQLTAAIEASERDAGASAREIDAMRRDRDAIENQVEATIEARLSEVLERQGLVRSVPILADLVWPPVDFEFTESPRILAISYRDRIELKSSSPLREGLDLATVERIEREREARDDVSAFAFTTSGIAAYPSIVDYTTGYARLVEVVAHEWLHGYLFFQPLGFSYYRSNDLRTINETVADLVGRELAALVVAQWPLPALPSAAAPAPTVDVAAALRALRGEVDKLLAAGRIQAAEALMAQRLQELVAQGARLRRLNQAFFAFTNLYAGEAGNPVATSPIGPKIDELRRRSASLRDFVAVVSDLTSVADLERALAALD